MDGTQEKKNRPLNQEALDRILTITKKVDGYSWITGVTMIRCPQMNRSGYVRRPNSIFCSILLVSMWLLLAFANVRADDKLVLVSPHWEGIQREFETAFMSHYLRETGRTVELEWMDAGGTSEVLRFIRSEFKAKPTGIGIDIFFGGGLDPYLALKQEDLLEPYALPKRLCEKIPARLGGVPLDDSHHT